MIHNNKSIINYKVSKWLTEYFSSVKVQYQFLSLREIFILNISIQINIDFDSATD